ncbi:PTS transporter subunit EIIC [Clostridium sp. KNHs214]|uniref:PTS transporter subunit EIIC n=1 Tax=Clostridium sp. KNHs214 TaxID=1540257 RepID=UPI000550027C|nr:PTS transporter subunit EIIC [Clostridium sp. KNHs214]
MKNKGKRTGWQFFQMLGKTFMFPIALLSVSGMMLGLGAGLTDAKMIEMVPFLGNPVVNTFFKFLLSMGAFAFNNLGMMFAMAIPLGLLKEEKEFGAFSGFVGFMAMHLGTNFYLTIAGKLAPVDKMQEFGQATILGIQTYNTSVLGGIITGLIVYALYHKISNLKLPESLGFYSGPRLVPIAMLFVMGGVGLIVPFVWPPFFYAIKTLGQWISSSGPIGYFLYAAAERLTIPFGLNHLVTSTFRFTPVGGTAIINGQEYYGTLNMFMAYVANNEVIPLDLAGKMEQGKLMIQYGLVGAALAMYRCAKPERRKAIKGLLISGALTIVVGGISEPLEFLFLFACWPLFLVHTFLNGFANMVLPYLGVRMGFTGDIIQFFSFGVLRGVRTGWPIAVLFAAFYMALYYFLFKWAIVKFNIKTPGREDEPVSVEENGSNDLKNLSTYKGQQMLEALGGKENIISMDNCVTRLRLELKDVSLVNEDKVKAAGGIAVVHLDEHSIQVIIGTQVYALRKQISKAMEM